MARSGSLERGREAYEQQSWVEVYTHLSAADQAHHLEAEDLEQLAQATYLIGKTADSAEAWVRAHRGFLSRGDVERAVRCAFWLIFELMSTGEQARAGGWVTRARRLLKGGQRDCVERGYLLLPVAFQCIGKGDLEGAHATFCQAAEIGARFGDSDLTALARHSRGRVLIRMGEIGAGVALLDEAMVEVEAGELLPAVVGDVYCSVIEGCLEIFDLRRAQEWTAALTRWCGSQPDLVAYRGECMVRRTEILRVQGAWPEAFDAAQEACERFLKGPSLPATGAAYYQKAELHRLRGELALAEAAYREANRWGRKPQPGLALLRLAQGSLDAAAAAVQHAVDEAQGRVIRPKLLPAYVEIMLAAGDVSAARSAAHELELLAADLDAPFLRAVAAQARGAVALAGDDAPGALAALRQAGTDWREIEVPYEAARARVLIGFAYRMLGDEDTATLELEAACHTFEQLGAAPDLARVKALLQQQPREVPGDLTPRQVEVLRLVAAGKTNREIADAMFISEKTVARHVSNIFFRLDLSNRAAATAYAYEQGLA